jgi:hypothetical protein
LKGPLSLKVPVVDYKVLELPGVPGAKMGVAYVRAIDVPPELDEYMEVNPRVPNRTKKGLLSGPVSKGIISTLLDSPQDMVLKNQGIYLLVDEANYYKGKDDDTGVLNVTFTDKGRHGIINGGHTYTAIREAVERAEDQDLLALERAYVRLNIYQGIEPESVPEMAEGLNRSKQVDDPSLAHLQGEFDLVRKSMSGKMGEHDIAYNQGGRGDVYISEILVYLSMFNTERYDSKHHPNSLYNRQALGLKHFKTDMEKDPDNELELIKMLPEFLWLGDKIRQMTPDAAKKSGFRYFVSMSSAKQSTRLPFIGETVEHRVPNGWLFPMLAAFRANLKRNKKSGELSWRAPLEQILEAVLPDLVAVCVAEHRDNNARPELIGKRESAYAQCYTKVELWLAKKQLLN